MSRVKRGTVLRKRHNRVLKRAKGYFGRKGSVYRVANQAVMKSGQYAYVGRKRKKRDFRQLWIARINAESRVNGLSYSKFINGLKKNHIEINRKMLAEMAIHDKAAFSNLCELAKKAS